MSTLLVQGKHMRFLDSEDALEGAEDGSEVPGSRQASPDGAAELSPAKPLMRGLPVAAGSHVRFDD